MDVEQYTTCLHTTHDIATCKCTQMSVHCQPACRHTVSYTHTPSCDAVVQEPCDAAQWVAARPNAPVFTLDFVAADMPGNAHELVEWLKLMQVTIKHGFLLRRDQVRRSLERFLPHRLPTLYRHPLPPLSRYSRGIEHASCCSCSSVQGRLARQADWYCMQMTAVPSVL